jgi:mono/diheme cytochrome c family protein
MKNKSCLATAGLAILAVVVLFGLAQLVPYGRSHNNPPVVQSPKWDSQQTLDLAKQACFDCHSNETVWRWYSNIAPFSWLIQSDVDRGRRAINFSEWTGSSRRTAEMNRQISSGEMPPVIYLPIHPEAILSAAEKQQLIQGLQNSLK